jgi:hypothetical protein
MINADTINDYLEWRQEKANQLRYYGEAAVSPENWIEEILMSEARDRINLIKDLLESEDLDPLEVATKIHSLVYDPIEDLHDDEETNEQLSVGASG